MDNRTYSLFTMSEKPAGTAMTQDVTAYRDRRNLYSTTLSRRSRMATSTARRIERPAREWWSQSGSNRRPPACKAGALPAELWPQVFSGGPENTRTHNISRQRNAQRSSLRRQARAVGHADRFRARVATSLTKQLVGLGRLELPTSPLSGVRSNQLSYRPASRPETWPRNRHVVERQRGAMLGASSKKEKRRQRCPAIGARGP